MIKELIYDIMKRICDYQDDIQIKEIDGENSSIIEIHVNKKDQGKIIGKRGRVIDAIRTIIYSISYKTNKRYNIEIIGDIKEEE